MSDSFCGDKMNCQICPKAVDNAIMHASHPRGFHRPAQKCEENLMIFLLKGEILVNSQEYAGTMLRAGGVYSSSHRIEVGSIGYDRCRVCVLQF